MGIFLLGLSIFTIIPFIGNVQLTSEALKNSLTEQEYANLSETLNQNLVGQTFGSTYSFSRTFIDEFNKVNDQLKAESAWDKVMWTPPADIALKLSQTASQSVAAKQKGLFFFLTFGLGIIGALIYIFATLSLQGKPGIKHDGVYHDSATNRGWIGILTGVWLVAFYVVLYFHAYYIVRLESAIFWIQLSKSY